MKVFSSEEQRITHVPAVHLFLLAKGDHLFHSLSQPFRIASRQHDQITWFLRMLPFSPWRFPKDHVRVGSTKSKRTDGRMALCPVGNLPFFQLGIDVKGTRFKLDI